MWLTKNSTDLCVLTLCIKFTQNNLYLASFPRISANSNENYRPYNFQALGNVTGNFQKYEIYGKFTTLISNYSKSDITLMDASARIENRLLLAAFESPWMMLVLFNQSINQHELAMVPHIQSSGAPEIPW